MICPRPDAGRVAVVTVMSVPTPYSDPSTLPCALRTPEDSAVTVITRATPTASPP